MQPARDRRMRTRPAISIPIAAALLVMAGLPAPGPIGTPAGPPQAVEAYAPESGCRTLPRFTAGGVQYFRDRIAGAGDEVAFTFDMNGDPNRTFDVLAVLIEERVCATIFLNGISASTAYGREVMRIIAANRDIFEVGNHTMHHCDLVTGAGDPPCPGTAPSAAFIQQELIDAAEVIRAGTGLEPLPFWRAPYGAINQHAIDAAAAIGYTKAFDWSIDTRDWVRPANGGRSTQQIVDHVLAGVEPGAIILMHLDGWNTADALRILIPELRARGYLLTSLSDLAIGEPLPPPSGTPYYDISDSPFVTDIVWLEQSGITAGCAEYFYCPRAEVRRDEMASFLARALGLAETGDVDFFIDDDESVHEIDINRLAYAAVTAGCGTDRYCPYRLLTRAEMASFLVRVLDLEATGGTDYFGDDDRSEHELDINRLAHAGLTAGCGDSNFCPDDPLTRGEMAAFLHRAFGP
jgi:peptidoglycan/xylan/chitin deacetylase (PgdA/CDA1 family)